MNWLDWLIAGIIALSAFHGLRCGLLISVAKLAGLCAGLVVAFTYYRPFAQYLSGRWGIEQKILPLVDRILKSWLPAGNNYLPPVLPSGKTTSTGFLAVNQTPLGDYLSSALASGVLEALSFLVLLIATAWVVNLAGRVLTKITDISFLGPLNHLGGLFFGAVRGLIVVMILLVLVSPLQRPGVLPGGRSGAPGIYQLPGKTFQDSKLLPYFEPLFNAIGRPLPGFPSENNNGTGKVKSI